MVVDVFGRFARFLQLGDAQRYMACFAIGVAALVFFATRPPAPAELKVSVEGLNVQVDARRAGRQSPRELEVLVTTSTTGARRTRPRPRFATRTASRASTRSA